MFKKSLSLLCVSGALLLTSCYQDPEFPPKPTSSIELTQESDSELLFDENEGSITVSFVSAKAWTAVVQTEEGQEWCDISPAGGQGGKESITVSVSANPTPDERKTTILIKSGVSKQVISVNQKPSGSILLSPSTLEVPSEGGSFNLIAKALESCSVSVPAEYQEWISAFTTRSVSTPISVTVAKNETLNVRTGQVIVKNDKTSETVTITQAAADPTISLSRTSYECSEEGGEFTVDVNANVPVTVTLSEAWIEADPSNPIDGTQFRYTVKANDSTADRTGTITFENNGHGVSQTVTVSQSGKKGSDSIRILAIGNSFSDDALEYLYQILQQAGYNSIKLGNLYIGGCSLATHAGHFTSAAAAYDYRVNVDGTWQNTPSFSSVDAINSDNWDFISLQQASGYSGLPDSYDPYLSTLIEGIKALRPNAKLIWHMTWAYQQTSTHSDFPNYNNDQMTMYNAIVNAVQTKVLPKTDIKMVIPCGTAIQNLRTSVIGDNLTRDGYHLSTDIGRFTAALMWAKQISECDLSAISWTPKGCLYTRKQLEAIKEAVNNAYAKPFQVTASTVTEDDEDINASLESVLRAGGYDPSKYEQLSFDLIHPGYYNSSSNIPSTVQTNMKNYATTRIFSKSEFPDGTLIVQRSGYGYRPEGWVAVDQKNTSRPGNTTTQIVEADEDWWGDFNFRAFNIYKTGVSDLTPILEEVKASFGIFVPKAESHNADLEAIIRGKGYDVSKYRMLSISITTYAYYNSTDKNLISTPGTNMKNYAATEIIPKAKIPNGSLIVQKEGYQYRPEGWTALDVVTTGRPANVTETLVVVDDEWWREFNYRGFNLAEKGNPSLDDARQELLKTAFGIYVPVQ